MLRTQIARLIPPVVCAGLVICAALAADDGGAKKKIDKKPDPPKVSPENGISIGATKVFDNRALTLMLESLSETMRGLQVIDQEALRKNLGLIQGSRTEDVSRSFDARFGGTPKVENTADSMTEAIDNLKRTQQDGKAADKAYEDFIEKIIDRKLTQKDTQKTVTTTSERLPELPKLLDLAASPGGMPGFGQSPSDLFSDQVNLMYQIFNVRMLLERSLTDRLIDGEARLQAVLGFNITLDPPKDAPDAAAVVEVTVEALGSKSVSLVAMMPQEKTYNAVALSTKTNAFGGAAVAKMFSVGYSERRRGQNYYLYRDNDTLAFERMATPDNSLKFGWQFRPVLGRRSVAPGLRHMLAVISLPKPDKLHDEKSVKIKLTMRTYWRKYYPGTLTSADRKDIGPWPYLKKVATLALTEPVPNGKEAWRLQNTTESEVEVPTTWQYQQSLAAEVHDVAWYRLDDKTALVSVTGENFFSGTSVVIGSSRHTTTADGLIIKSTQAMDVVTPIDNLGAGAAAVIGRYGGTTPLRTNRGCTIKLDLAKSTLRDAVAGQRTLLLFVNHTCRERLRNVPPAVYVAGKSLPNVRPFEIDESVFIETEVPESQVQKGGTATVIFPFIQGGSTSFPLYDTAAAYKVERVGDADKSDLLIRKSDTPFNDATYGTRKGDWKVGLDGNDFKLDTNSQLILLNASTLLLRSVAPKSAKMILYEPDSSEQSDNTKFIPRVLDVPELKPKPKAAVEALDPAKLAIETNDTPRLVFEGTKVADVDSVLVGNFTPIKPEYDADKKQLTIFINQQITANPAKHTLQFRDAAGKLLGTVELVVKARPKPAAPETKPMAPAKPAVPQPKPAAPAKPAAAANGAK